MSLSLIHEMIQTYGLWILFTGIMLECLGVPMPGETILVSAALYAGSTNRIAIASVILVAATAATIGGSIGYAIGRFIGIPMLLRYGTKVMLHERRLRLGQYLFLLHGGKIVFFGRFIAFLRIFAAMLAGANRMSPAFFLVINAFGGICWAVMFGGGAYLIGGEIDRVTGPVRLLFAVLAIGLIAAGVIYFRRHERELERRAETAIPGPLFGAPANRPHGQ